jgi:D-alanyl-D-alanine carboxypeptidase/D-alanyl-D-alanine-endopeptidase (penicillin-binding protein 4)
MGMLKTGFLVVGFVGLLGGGSASAANSNRTLDLAEADLPPGLVQESVITPALDWERYFAKHPELRRLRLGIQMGGVEPLQRSSNQPQLPASTEKLVTAAAALRVLGPDFRFPNHFSARLHRGTGVLSGVTFSVSGDPTWSNGSFSPPFDEESPAPLVEQVREPRFDALIESLVARGVKTLQGPVSVVSLRPELDTLPRPEGWKDSWRLECMAMMQTSFQSNGNCGTVAISGGRAAWLTRGVTIPLRLRVTRSRRSLSTLSVLPEWDATGRIRAYTFRGTLGRGALTYDLPVHSGGLWLSELFRQALKERGIRVVEGVAPRSPDSAASSGEESIEEDLSSEPLVRILTVAVQRSVNGIMDRIFHEVARAARRPGSEVLLSEVAERVGDRDRAEGLVFADGSGLDLRDRIRPDALHAYLSALREEAVFPHFYSTLAVAGVSGTLRSRPVLSASPFTRGRIHAKTGTLTGINNLAGYFEGEGKRPEPFVVFTEGSLDASTARSFLDGIVVNFAAQNTPATER